MVTHAAQINDTSVELPGQDLILMVLFCFFYSPFRSLAKISFDRKALVNDYLREHSSSHSFH